jgi:phytoene dehydrogenase-like protein
MGTLPDADAIVVGAGPNGLAAAIAAAERGLRVLVLEGAETPGGGARSAPLTLPGFVHDVCSAVHPLGVASPFFRSQPLDRHGLDWVHPAVPLAHPFDDGTAAVLDRSVEETGRTLGPDAGAYADLMGPCVGDWADLAEDLLSPSPVPRHPIALARFGSRALRSVAGLAEGRFAGGRAKALLAGLGAHSFLPLDRSPSAAIGLVLGALGHVVGWPMPRGGAQRLTDALVSRLRELGGRIETGRPVRHLGELGGARWIFLDVTPRQLLSLADGRLGAVYRAFLRRYRYGPGVFKVDWALDGPIPWAAPECLRAGTVHVGGTLDEIAASERQVSRGIHPERPFVLVAQQSLFDPSRAPDGKQTGWAYCHVPNGSDVDMTERIERQIERFASGFRDRILARHVRSAAQYELYDPNCIGGDINGGMLDLVQTFARPVPRLMPYATGLSRVYLCSSSTPPGGGVHGMCGYNAVRAAMGGRHVS